VSRTVIVSDPQGEPTVLERALACSRYEPGSDRLIVAGDIVGVEPGGMACVRLAEASGGQILVGNHELAFLRGETIDESEDDVDPLLFGLVRRRIESGAWCLAAIVDNEVVVTHGGLSAAFNDLFVQVGRDAGRLVATLNQKWRSSLSKTENGSVWGAEDELTGPLGPLWWRPSGRVAPLPGIIQVAGHTPPEILEGRADRLEAHGLYLVDPFTRGWLIAGRPDPPPCRYAVVEDGHVEVHGA
jgi:hypothetical protein